MGYMRENGDGKCRKRKRKDLLLSYPTRLEISESHPERVEETECTYDLDLESIIREKVHEWEESKI
jgi:hypothetical protein